MAFEIGECNPEEYKDGEPNRVREGDLDSKAYYTWMLVLRGGPYKVPARIEEVTVFDETSGLFMVRNTIVDEAGKPLGATRNHIFHDGYYMREEHHDFARLGEFLFRFGDGDGDTERVYTGYFRDDYEGNPPLPGEVSAESEVPTKTAEASAGLQPIAA